MRPVLAVLAICAALSAQSKLSGSDIGKMQSQAAEAFKREMARDKAGDCPNANTTLAIRDCLGRELDTTRANFKQFTDALRTLLSLDETGAEQKEFDTVSEHWDRYAKAQCEAAYNLNKGGTIAPVNQVGCQILLLRSRLRELNAIYDGPLHL